jgi:dipeptidyl aminopeptidase/acylaminoacyl peptidase
MRGRRARVAIAVVLVLVVGIGAVLIGHYVWQAVTDPASAQCSDPAPELGEERTEATHRELDVTFTCEGAQLAGTIYFPTEPGRHPGVVWVHGAGEAERLGFGGQLVPGLVQAGVAVLSYDKRGVGESEGDCCPGDQGRFNLLTADAEGAVRVLQAQDGINPDKVGLVGASQAGWIAPRAANNTNAAFVALASAPTVSERTANLYERLAGGEKGALSREEISRRLRESGSSGYDPLPDLQRMTMPGLWLFGSADDKTPVEESVAILDQLKSSGHDFTVRVFPGAGHGLLDVPPTAPEAPITLINWIAQRVA